jgi:hypothetical protein
MVLDCEGTDNYGDCEGTRSDGDCDGSGEGGEHEGAGEGVPFSRKYFYRGGEPE